MSMEQYYKIIHHPIISEKSTDMKGMNNQLVFKVAMDANKVEIKKAIEAIFGVKVLSVRTLRVVGKKKRLGRYMGKRPDWKKAIVKLKEGDSIDFFEGV